VLRELEARRAAGQIGSSLQAEVELALPAEDRALLAGLGDDLRFVLITSSASLVDDPAAGPDGEVRITASRHPKCERCWHLRADVGHDPDHPTLCGRCTANLYGSGEPRHAA
jgi:isoleucyl-tRNA synthetase